jgi:hypothetical protein
MLGFAFSVSIQAQSPPVSPMYRACYVADKTGVVYRVDDPANGFPAPGAAPVNTKNANGCAGKNDQSFVWNQTGPQGPIGVTGPTGATGLVGAKGAVGETGPRGAAGEAGAVGAVGPTGATGATGAQGRPGEKGETGPPGPPGADGQVGAQGPPGEPASAGISGYQIVESPRLEVAAHGYYSAVFQCPDGKVATGAGFIDDAEYLKLIKNGPQASGIGWSWLVGNPTDYTHAFVVRVVCVNGSP